MARTSRQERRQRRGIAAGTPPLQPARKPQPAVAGGPPASPPAPPVANGGDDSRREPSAEGRRGIWGVRFISEAIAELRKVEWPDQHRVVSGTAVVIVACVLVGTYLYVNDRVWAYVVQHILLR